MSNPGNAPKNGPKVANYGDRRDTISGKLLAEMSEREVEAVWARRVRAMAKGLDEHSGEISTAVENRLIRLNFIQNTTTYLEDAAKAREKKRARRESGYVEELESDEEEPVVEDPLEHFLDLTDYLGWFKEHFSKEEQNVLASDQPYIQDAREYAQKVNEHPRMWFELTKHLVLSQLWSDIRLNDLKNKKPQPKDAADISAKLEEASQTITQLEDELQETRDKHTDEMTDLLNKRTRYRQRVTELKEQNDKLREDTESLRRQLKDVSPAAGGDNPDGNDSADDSDSSFLRDDHSRTNNRKAKQVRFNRSPTFDSNVTTASSNNARAPQKVETFTGERDQYDEWVGKLLSQMEASPEYFEGREERRINYLIQSLSGSAYDLIKDTYGYAGRRRNPHAKFEDALKDLDRAYYPVDIARNARAKLERLTMGKNESFAEFFPKFQAQVNRLQLSEEHKVDELTKRLNSRFADRILDGNSVFYDSIIDRCYRMDSQLSMWTATNIPRRSDNHGGSNTTERPARRTSSGNKKFLSEDEQRTVKLGAFAKPLAQMSVAELRTWRAGLPRGKVILERLMKEHRCLDCQQSDGHRKGDAACALHKLHSNNSGPSVNVTTTAAKESGKEDA